jgi:Anti-sigma-K factor rskA
VQHCDDDALALVALGETPSPADAAHLSGCAQCRAEIESFGRVVAAGRGDRTPAVVVPPPAHVWDGIAAATGVGVRPRNGDVLPPATPSPLPAHAPVHVAAPDDAVAPVLRMRPRSTRGRRWPMLAVAASALVVGGVGGSVVTQLVDRGDPQPTPIIVAQAALDPLPVDPAASGRAVVVQADGGRVLEVDVSKLASTDGFYEVWLIDASVKKMVPIGVLTGSTGRFTIPDGLDLGQFPVVDISAEPLDGDPVHSGKSLLRGTIPG